MQFTEVEPEAAAAFEERTFRKYGMGDAAFDER
jgi:hypothetical protein